MDLSNIAEFTWLQPVTAKVLGSVSSEDLTKYLTWAIAAAAVGDLIGDSKSPLNKMIQPLTKMFPSTIKKTMGSVAPIGSLASLFISVELHRRASTGG